MGQRSKKRNVKKTDNKPKVIKPEIIKNQEVVEEDTTKIQKEDEEKLTRKQKRKAKKQKEGHFKKHIYDIFGLAISIISLFVSIFTFNISTKISSSYELNSNKINPLLYDLEVSAPFVLNKLYIPAGVNLNFIRKENSGEISSIYYASFRNEKISLSRIYPTENIKEYNDGMVSEEYHGFSHLLEEPETKEGNIQLKPLLIFGLTDNFKKHIKLEGFEDCAIEMSHIIIDGFGGDRKIFSILFILGVDPFQYDELIEYSKVDTFIFNDEEIYDYSYLTDVIDSLKSMNINVSTDVIQSFIENERNIIREKLGGNN